MKLLYGSNQILTCETNSKNFKVGKELNNVGLLSSHSVIIEDGIIKDLIPNQSIKNFLDYDLIDVSGKTILPGLVECHTHLAFAGNRSDEFKMKLEGVTYEEIAAKGGGILNTVSSVRSSSVVDLFNLMKSRVEEFISQGVTCIEIKSGYGLDFENEMKLLHAIKLIDEFYPIEIISTFLGAHTYPIEFKENHKTYIDEITNKMLPHISKNKLAEFCDAFCESTAFSADEVDFIFSVAKQTGIETRLHTEQFNIIGGIDVALKHNSLSVDHLEVIDENGISKLSGKNIVSVLFPGVSFFLNHNYAPARKLIDSDCIVALSSDYNPGSSNILNLHLVMQIAALKMKMSAEEIINSVTINAAKALKRNDQLGSIEIGKKADFAVFDTDNYSDIFYNVGRNLNCMTIKNGDIIFNRNNINK
jgi:imidazolonepropionase